MNVIRYKKNPIITPSDIKPLHQGFEVIGAFNAGVAKYNDEILLLLRVAERPISDDPNIILAPIYHTDKQTLEILRFEKTDVNYNFDDPRLIRKSDDLDRFAYLTSLSYIRIARSRDGRNFTVDNRAFLYPFNEYQTFGIEDARCTQIDDKFYITFSSVSEKGVCDSMIVTQDFEKYDFLGNIFVAENKDVVIFPEQIDGKYYALHRPSLKSIGNYDIWLAESLELTCWGNHHHLIGVRVNSWDSGRVGAGLPPIKTKEGWLIIYHGATADHRYCMGAALLDLVNPSIVISRSEHPILEPDAEYEKNGFFGEVVFGCGGIVEDDKLIMYYGVSDTSMAVCEMSISEIVKRAKNEL